MDALSQPSKVELTWRRAGAKGINARAERGYLRSIDAFEGGRMLPRLISPLLFALALGGAAAAADVSVRIDSGEVVGTSDGAVAAFKGVPFAAPPVGPLRWKPPAPPAPWTTPLPAKAYGPACSQSVNADGRPNGGGYAGPISEDCLNLNVWAPAHARNAPVMVWIFGGGDVAGANSIAPNDGSFFARDGVILVSVNYRLGALGFFGHPALTTEAGAHGPLVNYGIMDQIAALKWVRRNIKAFGGDPSNVTIFGESAGGEDVLALMTIPAARGLFEKATVQSGGGWGETPDLRGAEQAGVALAEKLGLPANASADQLRALPVDKLIAAGGHVAPTIDGRLMTESVAQAFDRGDQAPARLIIGSNSWEASLLPPANEASYLAAVPATTKAAYADEAVDPGKQAQNIFTDALMAAPARWIAGKSSSKAPAWLYEFSYVRVIRRGKIPGANHTSENPYVFDTQMIVPNYSSEIVAEDRAMAAVVHSCWVAFAKTGVPTCTGAQAWPVYDPASDQLMEFGLQTGVRQHFRKLQLDAQAPVLDKALTGP